ncbi:MAG: hypothetical protein MJZ23_06040 [Paludibacteraceae bacterium]|nr:hypothetical protein [Paludibacteraceae bacterium]
MDEKFLETFEGKLLDTLLRISSQNGLTDKQLLQTEDIGKRWQQLAPEYMADAVPNIQDYPSFSVGCALYLGMGVAWGWDADWETYKNAEYKSYYGDQGFDNMDDHITEHLYGIRKWTDEAKQFQAGIKQIAEATVSAIRHEQIEPQSQLAFYMFHSACKVMFFIGASIGLKRLGYKFEKIDFN